MRQKIIEKIFEISRDKGAFDILEKYLDGLSKAELIQNIIECGTLPEFFEHDSSEEKIWAKYSDILLSLALNYLGIRSSVIGMRSDSADVLGKTEKYTLVADAKTFRLSRTAKNQKDFKVQALDNWRQTNNYALLVAPLIQYPNRTSQIYAQAIGRNVTLLSYTHLYLLLNVESISDLSYILETGSRLKLKNVNSKFKDAKLYWEAIDEAVCNVANCSYEKLEQVKLKELSITKELGEEGIKYWERKIKEFNNLSKKEAIELLIKANKIDQKINTIQRMIRRTAEYEQ